MCMCSVLHVLYRLNCVKPISYGNGTGESTSQQQNSTTESKTSSSSRKRKLDEKEDTSDNNLGKDDKNQKNSRRTGGKQSKCEQKCLGPCFVWKFLGSLESEVPDHKNTYRHVAEGAEDDCKTYLSAGDVSFAECDGTTCMCTKCYLDFAKNRTSMNTENTLPYWLKNRTKKTKDQPL